MSERIRVNRVCEITGLGKRQVQAMAVQGKIPGAAQLGRLWTFDEGKLRRWIALREKACQGTSTNGARHTGAVFKLPDTNIEAAYIRAIGLKRSRGSAIGLRASAVPSSTDQTE